MADGATTTSHTRGSQSVDLDEAVSDLMDSVFTSVDLPLYSDRNKKADVLVDDPSFCPRAVHLETEPRNESTLVRNSFGDTRIDEVVNEEEQIGGDFYNVSDGDYLPDSCPLHFEADDVVGRASDESFETEDPLLKPTTTHDSSADDCVDEAILKLKRQMLTEDSDEDELDDSDSVGNHVLSSPTLDRLKSPRKVPDQARQNILATLVHSVEKRLHIQKRKAEQSPAGETHGEERTTNETSQQTVRASETRQEGDNILDLSESFRQMGEEAEGIIDEGTSHLRDSLMGVLEALKYVLQPTQGSKEAEDSSQENIEANWNADGDLRNRSTQTPGCIGTVGDERLDVELLLTGLQEEFQRCLWVHAKLTEDAYQLGFDRGLQNALFLQDLTEESVQMIWSLREERRQLEKYMKEKEHDWKAMSRAFTQEVVDLRRENYQLISAEATKEAACGGRRIKPHHLKTLLKSKHDLEKAFSLNVEKQDKVWQQKINELKMLVLKQQKGIRALQERLLEDQAANMLLRFGGDTDRPDTDSRATHSQESDATSNNENSTHKDTSGEKQSSPSSRLRAEDVAKLQDVLYCDHGHFSPNQSPDPEIAAMRVYGIGGEELASAGKGSSPGFNSLDLSYSRDATSKSDQSGESFGFDTSDICKSESNYLASGDAWNPTTS